MARDYDALLRFIAEREVMPFDWGDDANDCVSFANASAIAHSARNPVRELGVSWSSAIGAARVLKRVGGVEAAVTRALPIIPVSMAKRGDWGLVVGKHGKLVTVIEGETAIGPGEKRAVRFDRRQILTAWSLD